MFSAQIIIIECAGLGWDRVSFLHWSKHEAMLWICAENSADNPGVF